MRKRKKSLLQSIQASGFPHPETRHLRRLCLRLLYECLELMQSGRITLPRPEKALLIKVRSGAWTFARLMSHAKKLFAEVETAVAGSPLPEKVDRKAISRLLARVQLERWRV